jgi:hypothetical protein
MTHRIAIVGDAHCKFAWETIASWDCVGPVFMTDFNPEIRIDEVDICVFSYGELDCRVRIHEAIQTNPNIINELVDAYIAKIVALGNPSKYGVLSIPPASDPSWCITSEHHPHNGTNAERASYVQQMNAALKAKCEQHFLWFIDTHQFAADENGMMKHEASTNGVLITNPQTCMLSLYALALR